MSAHAQLEQAITAQESLRGTVPEEIIDAGIAALKTQLASLDPTPSTPTQQRKQITVLFADVSGFTAMSETMDAEDVSETMNTLWKGVDGAILKHGGYIDKHIGDGIMALWGVNEARENDPEQAIRGALAMQEAIQAFTEKHRVSLKMRVGLNTGSVLLGEVGTTGEFTAMGDAVNVAARMESSAPVGGVLISHDTYHHVRGVFDVEVREPISVKGKSEPLQVYVVQQAKPRAFRLGKRGIEGIETKMIGRDQELQQLQDAYQAVVTNKQTTVLSITGEAGVGKSRLLYEFDNWLKLRPEGLFYFKGRARQQAQGVPNYLLRDMVANRYQILDSDVLTTVREKFTSGVSVYFADETNVKAPILGSWLGYDFSDSPYLQKIQDDSEQIKNRATLYLTQLFAKMADKQPVVVLLEDIHWADGVSLDTFVDLAHRQPKLPLLIVCVARPSLTERRTTWGKKFPVHTWLEISPLTTSNVQTLVKSILRLIKPLPSILVELITAKAEGNPFYAEELIKMLIDDGVIVTSANEWQVVPKQLLEIDVPPTLKGVLQARLDRLKHNEKIALQKASVIGRIFWDKAVTSLGEESEVSLSSLETKELIFSRSESSFENTAEYIFKHAILHDVTYETVLKNDRHKYHSLAADWLVGISKANNRSDESAALIAEHYYLAGKTADAAFWYKQAGEIAVSTYSQEEAHQYLSLALQLAPEKEKEDLFSILSNRVKIYEVWGQWDNLQADIEQMRQIADSLTDEQQRKRQILVALTQAKFSQITGDLIDAESEAAKAIHLAVLDKDSEMEADGRIRWVQIVSMQGRYSEAQEEAQNAFSLARQKNLRLMEGRALAQLGIMSFSQGQYEVARQYYQQSLSILRDLNYMRGEAMVLANLAHLASQTSSNHAKTHFEQAVYINRQIGNRRGVVRGLINLGNIAKDQGQYETALNQIESVLPIVQEMNDRLGEAPCYLHLADIYRRLGDYNRAENYSLKCLQLYEELGTLQSKCLGQITYSLVLYSQGKYDQAFDIQQATVELADRIDLVSIKASALVYLGNTLVRMQQFAEANKIFQKALVLLNKKMDQKTYIELHAGLARLALVSDDTVQARQHVELITPLLEDPSISLVVNPTEVYLTCYEVLTALDAHEDAVPILKAGNDILQKQASSIADEKRRKRFLEGIETHHKLQEAYILSMNEPNRQ